jgi:hypothetical protein
MPNNIEIMPGVTVDLNEGLEPGDLIDGKTIEEDYEAKENAAVEGAEGVIKEEDKPKVIEENKLEVKDKVEIKPEDESLQIFKIKYAGEERELKLTQEQLIVKLQKAEDYDVKMAKLAEDRRQVEPFKHILDTPWFKGKLEEGLADGSIAKPAEVQPAPEEAIFDLERRKMDPDFENIREAMRTWALTLPAPMLYQLDNNVVVFNREYDRIAEKIRAPRHSPPLTLTKKDEKKVDKVIQAKEKAKDLGRIESAGSASELDPNKTKDERVKELRRYMKKGGPRQDEAAAAYLLLTAFSKDN